MCRLRAIWARSAHLPAARSPRSLHLWQKKVVQIKAETLLFRFPLCHQQEALGAAGTQSNDALGVRCWPRLR